MLRRELVKNRRTASGAVEPEESKHTELGARPGA